MKFAEESPEPPLEKLYDYTFVNEVGAINRNRPGGSGEPPLPVEEKGA